MTTSATKGVAIVPLGWALSVFFALTFLLCSFGAAIPFVRDLHFLQVITPWLSWSQPGLVLLATVWVFVLGWYAAVVIGGVYNLALRRG